MENTIKNKYKFFAQYYNQEVARYKSGIISDVSAPMVMIDWLELKPLSSITDEDAIEIAEYLGWETHTKSQKLSAALDFINGDEESCDLNKYSCVIDSCRHKGYAIPYMGLSVETQIEYGWIKLTPNTPKNGK